MTTANMNQINLVGRLGKDPEIRYFESGKVITKISLAVNRNKKDEQPDWFELQLWNKTAEIAANYTKKGSLIGIEGELKIEEWEDKNTGVQRSKPVIVVNRLELLSSSNNAQTSSEQTNNYDEF
jgi:single-strand DNA-binding protein